MIYHEETTNKSFTKLVANMKNRGVDVSHILHLNDEDLRYVDPFDPELDVETQAKVIKEVKKNFWYFIREVARVPISFAEDSMPVKAHRGNIALWSVLLHGFNAYIELPRQIGNTLSAVMFTVWKQLREQKYSISCASDSESSAMNNIHRVETVYNKLPVYLTYKQPIFSPNPAVATIMELGNTTYVDYVNNGRASACEVEARKNKSHIKWMDRFTTMDYNDAILNTYLQDCSKNHGQIIVTSAIGFDNDRRDVAAQRLIMGALQFDESMYDMTIHQIEQKLINYPSKMIYITFDPMELDLDEEYLKDQIQIMFGDLHKTMRDIFMQRPSDSLINTVKHLREKGYSEEIIEKVIERYVRDMTVPYND